MLKPSILIVEDEIVVAMELEEKLSRMGYRVRGTVASGEAALDFVETDPPDVVLMDIRLEGDMDGIQAARVILEHHNIPVIYLTAHADERTLERAKLTEPFGYLVKPFSETGLRTTIEVAVYKHGRDKQVKESVEWLSTTLSSLGGGVIVTDENGLVKYLNSVAEEMTGWRLDEAVGKSVAEVYVLKDRDTGEILGDRFLQSSSAEAPAAGSAETFSLVAGDDSEIEIQQTVIPVPAPSTRRAGSIIAFQEGIGEPREEKDWFRHAANLYLSAALCCADGDYPQAESFYRRALHLFEKGLGGDHPKVLTVLGDMADLYRRTGRIGEAEKLEARAARIRSNLLLEGF